MSRATLPAFSQGYQAAMHGKLIKENPYQTKAMREAWDKGFREFENKIRSIRK